MQRDATLIEAMNNYVESARVGPEGFNLTEDIFEIEMLAVVRSHGMALNPDAVRYLKAVLTAEAMVKELDPQFDLRAHENRFFGRLMELEAIEALDPRRLGQRILDARVRARAGAGLRLKASAETPRDLIGVALDVRRRVQFFSALTIVGWGAVLAAVWVSGGKQRLAPLQLPDDAHRLWRSARQPWPAGVLDSRSAAVAVGVRGRPPVAVSPPVAVTRFARPAPFRI